MSGEIITGQVLGAERVAAKFADDAASATKRLAPRVQRLGLKLLARVKAKLSDDVLHVKTGRLRRSVNEATTIDGSAVTSTVGTPVSYGAFWERGFHGVEQVAAHERKIAHPAKGSAAVALVRAHSRKVNQAPRSFLVSSLNELRPHIVAELSKGAA